MSKQASILQYSRSDRSASRANRTPSTVDKNASSSHHAEPDKLHDYYANRVASTFPHQEDPVRLNAHEAFGFQDLLATQGVPRDATNMFREFNVHQDYAGGVGDEVDEDGSDERGFDESREGSNMRCSQDPDCLHSIHGSSCSRSSVSIKRKSFDTAIDPVSGKKELSLYGTSEFNNASCGREIGIILRSNFKGPWYSWDKVDAMCKDELFKEFKLAIQCDILSSGFQKPVNTLNWPPFSSILVTLGGPGGPGKRNKYAFPEEDEVIVRKIWEDKARTCLNLQLTRARKKAMSIIGTTNIIDCLDKGPVWIQNEDWNTMINDVWSTDRFCKRSKTSKQNRLKQTDGKITRTGRGKELPWDEVFSALHQKSNETGTFVDNRSKIVVEKYRNEMVARYGPDQDNHPSFDGAAWCEASGGVSKGRVYGAPRMPKSKVDVSSSSHTYSVNHHIQAHQLLDGHMGLGMPTPMAPSMPSPVAPSMPSPVAPSMPSPTMAPGHRPRPQMPYNGPSSSHQQHRPLPLQRRAVALHGRAVALATAGPLPLQRQAVALQRQAGRALATAGRCPCNAGRCPCNGRAVAMPLQNVRNVFSDCSRSTIHGLGLIITKKPNQSNYRNLPEQLAIRLEFASPVEQIHSTRKNADIARVGSVTVELGGDDKEVSPFINCEGVDSLTCTTCQGSGIQPRYLDRRYESNNHVPYTPDSQ
uniref:Uncharacterized protein n=1 Tax=Salix viminalis TaxID=40686 RepID=A0A6N2LCI4_SALVM